MLETIVIATVLLGIMKYFGADLPWYAWTSPLLVLLVSIALLLFWLVVKEKILGNKGD